MQQLSTSHVNDDKRDKDDDLIQYMWAILGPISGKDVTAKPRTAAQARATADAVARLLQGSLIGQKPCIGDHFFRWKSWVLPNWMQGLVM